MSEHGVAAVVEHLHHDVMGQRRRQMSHEVSGAVHHGHRRFVGIGQVGDLHRPGESPGSHAHVEHIDGAGRQQRYVVVQAIEVFT